MSNDKNQLWNFPCQFPIKIMGKATDEFKTFVINTLHKHVPNLAEDAIEVRHSENGNYLSITITVEANSKEQLDAIYCELTGSPLVLMAL